MLAGVLFIAVAATTVLAVGRIGAAGAAVVAPACGSTNISVQTLNGPVYYVDASAGMTSQYVGFKLTDKGASVASLWATLGNFRGASTTLVHLASTQSASQGLGALATNASTTGYWYTTDTSPATDTTTDPQYQDLTLYSGNPNLGGSPICTYTNSFSSVQTPITALANKVTNIITGTPVLGQTFTVEQEGKPGTIGAGPADDPGVFNMSPATSSTWPAGSFQLVSSSVTFCDTAEPCDPSATGNTSFSDVVHLANMDSEGFPAGELYTAYFTFKVVGGTTSTTSVSPNIDIASGTQVKHTAGLPVGISAIPTTTNSDQYLSLSAAKATLSYPGGTDAYTVTPAGTPGVVYQSFSAVIPSGSRYVPGSATWGGVATADPTKSGQTLTFTGPFTTDGSSNLSFTLSYPSSAGAGSFTTQVTGLAGDLTIGASAGSSTPATAIITIGKASAVISPTNGTVAQGSGYSYGYSVSGLVNGDTLSTLSSAGWTAPTCTSPYVPGTSSAGQYAISCSGASDGDYSFSYNTGTLTVLPSSGSGVGYDLNGGLGKVPSGQSGPLPYTVASATGFSLAGYVFTGWCTLQPTGSTCSGGTTYQPGEPFDVATSTTLHAIWAPALDTVQFHANDGTGQMAAETFTTGVSQALLPNGFSRSGYTFAGWSTSSRGPVDYNNGVNLSVDGDLDLYAVWSPQAGSDLTITYTDSSGISGCTDSTAPQSFSPGSSVVISAPNLSGSVVAPYGCQVSGHSGHTDAFEGWNTVSTGVGGTWYNPGDSYAGTTSLQLYAIWYIYGSTATTNDAFVAYDTEGGSGGPPTQDLGSTSPIALSTVTPSLTGYSFGGWCTIAVSLGASCTGTTYAAGTTYAFTPATLNTLYAIWTADSYTVNYDANGASGTVPSDTYTLANPATVASGSGLSKDGAAFLGWNTAADGSGTTYRPGSTLAIAATTTLYALWEYAVSYAGNGAAGGTVPASQLFTDSSVTVSGAGSLSRSGYTFVSWNSAADGTGRVYLPGDSYSSQASVILYAVWTPDNTHEVAYFGNGSTSGAVPSSHSFVQGSSVTIAANTGSLVLSGYTFAGWNTAANGAGTEYAAGSTYSGSASIDLYAVWLPNATYQVTYMANDASSGAAPAPQTFSNPNGSVTIAGNSGGLVRAGYVFSGWNTSADGGGTTYPAGAVYSAAANLTLYAMWTEIGTYEVTYSANGAPGGSAPGTQSFSLSPVTIETNTFAWPGNQFVAWNTSPDGSGSTYLPGDSYDSAATLHLYAQWVPSTSYSVVYDPNGATGGVAAQSFAAGGSVIVASGAGLTMAGFVFTGWNTAADGSGTSYSAGATYTSAANLTLYAQFAAVPYVVTYDANGGMGNVPSQDFSTQSGDVLSSSSGFTRSGYSFAGWNTSSDGSGISYLPGDTYDSPSSLYLFAQWIPSGSYAVIYDANGGTGSSPTQVFSSGSVTISGASGLSRTGYGFAGWNTKPDGTGVAYGPGTGNTVYWTLSDLVLYAQWSLITYVVQYDLNGGTGTVPSTQNFTTTAPAVIAAGSGLSNTGYTFSGWNTSPDGTGETYSVGSEYGLPYDLTLYARWIPIGDTVFFNANGGTGSMSSEAFTSGQAQALTANTFTRVGYTFAGWNTAMDGTGTSYSDGQSITLSSGMTLYAQWTANATVKITLENPAGTATVATLSGASGTSVTLPSTESAPAGYSFAGWATSPSPSTVAYQPGASYTLSSDGTLYEVFTANATVKITFDSEGGTSVAPITVPAGDTVALPGPPDRIHYIFLGWYTAAHGGVLVTSPYTATASVALYAHWQRLTEVPTGSGEVISQGGTVTKVPIKASGDAVTVGTALYGLKIKTTGTATTYHDATISLIKGSNAYIAGYGFKPGTFVHLYLFSKGTLLGIALVKRNGTYSGWYRVPTSLKDGHHSLESVGITYKDVSIGVAAPVVVMSRMRHVVIVPFAFASSRLTRTLRRQIVTAARVIVEYRVRTISLIGYTDPRGSFAYNLRLSRRRVLAVRGYLLAVLRSVHYRLRRVSIAGLGKRNPVRYRGKVDNQASRRVVIELG